jgi:hypothetical protein
MVYKQQGELRKAEHFLHEAAQLYSIQRDRKSEQAEAHRLVGRVQADMGKTQAATKSYLSAEQI